ncbi:hypothetical protein [Acinetobacter stercoris]|uniref:Uncharacterized protein n=1 Tax=Acinetobacter stercoris TaxID=2126983 RepID=A0A2U3N2U6_9GAMM|nr:hypothetical protein [Acinetobacter stercoris]SPL72020.1 hypothetical protein KPC_3198 [Acinetobacter stercoris]
MSDYQNQDVYFITDDETSHNDLQEALETIADQAGSLEEALSWNIEVHKKRTFTHSDFVGAYGILEHIFESGYSEGGEYAEDYLVDIQSNKEKLEEFGKLISDFLDKNAEQPRFWQSAGLLETITPTIEMYAQFGIKFDFGGENS